MDRRRFLHAATGTLVAGFGAPALLTACAADGPSSKAASRASSDAPSNRSADAAGPAAVGIQLYTLRSVMQDDFLGTLERVAELGYDEVEFAGYYDRSPSKIASLLERLGLASPATHVPLGRMVEAPAQVIETARAIGHRYVVCPYLAEAQRRSLDDYRRLADRLNAFGQQCTDAGLQLAYHNHDFEFAPMSGAVPYDLLLERTDPEHVGMELDLFWIKKAGYEPTTYFANHPGRFPLCHVKDMTADGAMAAVGEGQIDFASIFARAEQAGLEHYFVEHDNPESPMQTAETSLRTLRRMGGA
jgi:sugar phosphate isomerase/epimerase